MERGRHVPRQEWLSFLKPGFTQPRGKPAAFLGAPCAENTHAGATWHHPTPSKQFRLCKFGLPKWGERDVLEASGPSLTVKVV